jgi:hypothetical protein
MPVNGEVDVMSRDSVQRAAVLAGALAAMMACGSALAVQLGDQVEVHGYGSQDYVQTTDNTYLGADSKGSWDNNFLGLVGAYAINDKSKLWAQLEASNTDTTRFTWFFVDYQVSDSVSVHAGRVKYPTGLYNETIDAKFLQLSSIEPVLYQEGADMVHDAYTGVGVDYDHALGRGRIMVQGYVGQPYDPDNDPDLRDRAMVGGRITYTTPIDLRFLLSFNRGQVEILSTGEMIPEQRIFYSVDYKADDWDVKSEYAQHKFMGADTNAFYVQAGRTFGDKWTPFVRYENADLDSGSEDDDSYAQTTSVIGVGYRLLPNAVLRAEAHVNQGYALPVATGEMVAGAGKRNWTMFVVGIHFIF